MAAAFSCCILKAIKTAEFPIVFACPTPSWYVCAKVRRNWPIPSSSLGIERTGIFWLAWGLHKGQVPDLPDWALMENCGIVLTSLISEFQGVYKPRGNWGEKLQAEEYNGNLRPREKSRVRLWGKLTYLKAAMYKGEQELKNTSPQKHPRKGFKGPGISM